MRWRDWLLIRSYGWHLTTDRACERYRAPRRGSWLDRHSRGHSCRVCISRRSSAAWLASQSRREFLASWGFSDD